MHRILMNILLHADILFATYVTHWYAILGINNRLNAIQENKQEKKSKGESACL